jgi:hypothetical protein
MKRTKAPRTQWSRALKFKAFDRIIAVATLVWVGCYTECTRRQADSARDTADSARVTAVESHQLATIAREANRLTKETAERSWRDSRRAFLDFSKPTFQDPLKKPLAWTFRVSNRGPIMSPNYTFTQRCSRYLSEEPKRIPCPATQDVNRPLEPHEAEDADVLPPDMSVRPAGSRGQDLETFAPLSREFLSRLREVDEGAKNLYVFAVMEYDDGLGGIWRRQSCWFFTRRTEEGKLFPKSYGDEPPPGARLEQSMHLRGHRILPCPTLNTPETRIK